MSGKNSKARNTIQTQLRPGPQTATTSSSEPSATAEAAWTHANLDTAALKLELLSSLRKDIADIFYQSIGDALSTIKLNLQAVMTQLANDKAATDATMSKLTGTVGEMEHGLTECSDDIAEMIAAIKCLTATVAKLENKSALLKEAFDLVKEPLLDRPHRTLQPKPKPGDRPRAIVCRFHYHSDCVDILRRARELRQIKVRDLTISVFPDYTAKIARARAAFNENNARLNELASVISNLDQRYALNPSPELLKQRLDLQAEFDLISTKEAERLLLRRRGSYYERGDKASRLLAHQLRRQATSRLIHSIKNTYDTITTDPLEINATYKSFYSSLYKSEFPTDNTKINKFLQNLSNPVIDTNTARQLDLPLSLEEVSNAIKANAI
ncbi:hypothetical protein F2P81_014505 [Scophthalmus maximus]|uniref:Uncharacterized protein n=1 Tax=Scophthalmus maximus TaxID=52904 RepID=A0A6A4SHZ1_SCOMX|nr:hypothetical protein F2P81_014505 [Scophthalmus maximus]